MLLEGFMLRALAGGIGIAPFLILSDALKNKRYDLILLYSPQK